MTTAPAMPDFAKTVNAVGIRSSDRFERPVKTLNKIKGFMWPKNKSKCFFTGNRFPIIF